jgi:aspartyl-tRNA synthetase
MVEGPDGQMMSKKAHKKLMKKLEKDKKKAETKKKVESNQKSKKNDEELEEYVKDPNDPSADKFGDLGLIDSSCDPEVRFTKKYVRVRDLNESIKDQEVVVRARVHRTTGKGGAAFLVLRENFYTSQACIFVEDDISKGMVEYARRIPKESIVQIKGLVHMPDAPIKKCTQQVELLIKEIWTLHKSVPRLPFNLDDAANVVENQLDEDDNNKDESKQEEQKQERGVKKTIVVGQNTRLNNRIIDLRVPANQAIMRISAGICRYFRNFLEDREFIEIHSPKILGGTSEGGAEVFRLNYFEQPACLAQSPQLYKQMGVICDLDRVFEIGPVFRAEDSNTPRHLCEFTGLDLEMSFNDHYFEVVDVICELFESIFKNLGEKYKKEIDVVREQYPFEDFKFKTPVPRIKFSDACDMLKESGFEQNPHKDLETENEKELGRLIKEKYDTDFFVCYNYPKEARPFYSMLNPADPEYTNSYDFFMRGEEILSGAQRVHDPEMVRKRAIEKEIPPETIKDYIECFQYGAQPHAGGGIGLERVLKLYLGIHNIRKCSMFPRDPKRLFP